MCVTEVGPHFWILVAITLLFMPIILVLFSLLLSALIPGALIAETGGKVTSKIKNGRSKPMKIVFMALWILACIVGYILGFVLLLSLFLCFIVVTIVPGYFY